MNVNRLASSWTRAIFSAMTAGICIEFDNVGKRFDERVVFRNVSGRVAPGEILAVTGPNGSGKSTLVTILCGLVRPTRGDIKYVASEGGEVERADWRRHIGVVAPAMSVYEELTALENLRFFARVRGVDDADRRCRECLELVGLEPDRATVVRGFSTGMIQRLKIAQAMLHEPAVMFLDEPGSNLDPSGQDWLAEWVRSSAAEGRTLVLATNDRQEMEWGSHRVALVD